MHLVDRIVSIVSPDRALKNMRSRQAIKMAARAYDANSKSHRNNGWNKPTTSGREEASQAWGELADGGSELVRNNPFARRVVNIWSCNAVGSGITYNILMDESGSKKKKQKQKKILQQRLESWTGSTDCDYEGHNNLDGLIALWVRTIVERGGVFVLLRVIENGDGGIPLKLQSLEQNFIDKDKSNTELDEKLEGKISEGIQYNKDGQIQGYWFKDSPTGIGESQFWKASDVIHLFEKERIGQHMGISWLAAIATSIRNLNLLYDSKLLQQQIASCFGAIITGAENVSGSPTGESTESGMSIDSIEAGMIEYAPAGTEVSTINPPKADDSSNFETSIKQFLAAGSKISYEQLTGDYSRVNFASGRMGRNEFNMHLDMLQNQMLTPALNKMMKKLSQLLIIGGDSRLETIVEWNYSVRSSVNPAEELDVLVKKVRNGAMSPRQFVQACGGRIDVVFQQWSEDKALMDELKLVFDLDPSVFASTGNQLDDNDAASSNNLSNQNKGDDKDA